MAIETKTSLKSHFEKGDRPTSAQFSDLIDSLIKMPVSGDGAKSGFIEVETTALATAHNLSTFSRTFLISMDSTAEARDFMAITSASGGGGGAAGQGILNANVTASVVSQLGVIPVANLPDASAAAQGIIQVATTAQVSAGADNTLAVTPGNMAAHPGVPKAWVNFNPSAATPSVRSSYNVSAVTKASQGVFTVKFGEDMPNDESYVIMLTVGRAIGDSTDIIEFTEPVANSFNIRTFTADVSVSDPKFVNAVVFA